MQNWVPVLLVFVAVALGTVSLVLVWETISAASRRRGVMKRLTTHGLEEILPPELTEGALLQRAAAARGKLEESMVQLPHFRDLPFLLRQAGLSWTVQSYLMMVCGLALALGMVGLLIGGFLLAIILAAFGAFLPYIFVRRKRTRRFYHFEERFPEAIDLMGRAIRAGHPLSSGIRMVGEEAPEPVSGEFQQVFEQQRFGLPFEDALLAMADRVDMVDVRILVTAIMIQREVGGNLAEILDKIAMTIRARFTIRRQLRVYTAQGRLTGYVLAALPVVLAGMIYLLDREYISLLFEEKIGRIMVVVAVVLQVFGYLWIRKIVNIEI